jgi:3-oxoacyl-(acyl-carrier-protein) synthase
LEKRRVVITGMGAVAPNGIGVENFWDSLVHGRSAVRRTTRLRWFRSFIDFLRHFDFSTEQTVSIETGGTS